MVRGDRFGGWTVLRSRLLPMEGTAAKGILCRCDCGTVRVVRRWWLENGESTGCTAWCYARKRKPANWSKLYTVWWNMNRRCYDPSNSRYAVYGGRGVRVCARWRIFSNFYADTHTLWRDGLSIERKEVNGDYTPDNCIFVPKARQANNKTNTRWVEVHGARMSLADAVRKYAVVSYETVKRRLHRGGMSVEEALCRPLVPHTERNQ